MASAALFDGIAKLDVIDRFDILDLLVEAREIARLDKTRGIRGWDMVIERLVLLSATRVGIVVVGVGGIVLLSMARCRRGRLIGTSRGVEKRCRGESSLKMVFLVMSVQHKHKPSTDLCPPQTRQKKITRKGKNQSPFHLGSHRRPKLIDPLGMHVPR